MASGEQSSDLTGKAIGRHPARVTKEKSEAGIVPRNPVKAAAEPREGRPKLEGNSGGPTVTDAQQSEAASCGLARIRAAAKRDRKALFTSLLHHVDEGLLTEAYWSLKRQAAPGVDGMTWGAYGDGLAQRITDLHHRVQSGSYRAQPSKRAWIPKADGRMRPLGIAALEDKIIQQAASWILGAIYEQEFAGFSYGFRPGRSQHDALDALSVGISQRKVNWVLDADIKGFFDALGHEWMMRFLEHRVADPRLLRLIRKWLRAGVSEDGKWSKTTVGTPQGAVISPLLANLYLHHVFDLWVKWWRSHQANGDLVVVRYADDFVVGFQHRHEAEAFLNELRGRLAKFGLELHPEKTRLIEFGRFALENRERRGEGPPEKFCFLGFRYRMGISRTNGYSLIHRETIGKRLSAKLTDIGRQLQQNWHRPIPETGKWLRSVCTGYYNYHAVPGNRHAMWLFRKQVGWHWKRALERRSQKARLTWARMKVLIDRWLPTPTTKHPHPHERLRVAT